MNTNTAALTRQNSIVMPKTLAGNLHSLDFQLPAELEAGEPPEARGGSRDQVRLMVSNLSGDQVRHTHFHHLPELLAPGDILVINTSGTLNAALQVKRSNGHKLELHISTHLADNLWTLELRQITHDSTEPFYEGRPGERLELPGGGSALLHNPYRTNKKGRADNHRVRLWTAYLNLPIPVHEYLACYGYPIRYRYVREPWPLSYYQTVYATEPGSAEMPSAGRAFTHELITKLVARGVQFAPLLLHTGVASLEDHEPPFEEYYRLSAHSANAINSARTAGGRVIAIGTTVVRALETLSRQDNRRVHPGDGWTDLVITPQRGLRAIDGLVTGFHEPRATHLAMLQALAGLEHLQITYAAALNQGYLWYEFGDLHLILP